MFEVEGPDTAGVPWAVIRGGRTATDNSSVAINADSTETARPSPTQTSIIIRQTTATSNYTSSSNAHTCLCSHNVSLTLMSSF